MAASRKTTRAKTKQLKTGQVWTLINACNIAVQEIDKSLLKVEEAARAEGVSDELIDSMTRGVRNARAEYARMGELLEASDGVSVRESPKEA